VLNKIYYNRKKVGVQISVMIEICFVAIGSFCGPSRFSLALTDVT